MNPEDAACTFASSSMMRIARTRFTHGSTRLFWSIVRPPRPPPSTNNRASSPLLNPLVVLGQQHFSIAILSRIVRPGLCNRAAIPRWNPGIVVFGLASKKTGNERERELMLG